MSFNQFVTTLPILPFATVKESNTEFFLRQNYAAVDIFKIYDRRSLLIVRMSTPRGFIRGNSKVNETQSAVILT